MEEHSEDTSVRDAIILGSILLFMYVGSNITTISFDSILSGEAPANILAYLGVDVKVEELKNIIFSLQNTMAVIALIFFAGIIWIRLRYRDVHHKELEKYEPIHAEEEVAKGKSIQWKVILEHVNSESPAEWKIAILEADNMLDEILEDLGYVGETLAEKLKTMSRTKIASYDDIWEAHKIRNQIAHGGAIDMDLTKKMAKETVIKFGNAFKDLGYL